MRPEGSPLDLNNLPEEYHKQVFEESSTTTAASTDTTTRIKKKNGGKDDNSKIYECRFCSLKFCKSQALGGHMNRHRQERETETLNRARQLVFGNESLGIPATQMSIRDVNIGSMQSIPIGGFSHRGIGTSSPTLGDQCLSFRSIQTRLQPQTNIPNYSTNSSSHMQPYLYSSNNSSSSNSIPYSTTTPYSSSQSHHLDNDCFIGHVLPRPSQNQTLSRNNYGNSSSSFTCYGAPIAPTMASDGDLAIQLGKTNCGCNYGNETHKC